MLGFSESAQAQITIDFNTRVDNPLVKRISIHENYGLVEYNRNVRDMPKLEALGAQSLRVDLFMGNGLTNSWNPEIISGSASNPTYNWAQIDTETDLLNKANVTPYWCFCYIREPFNRSWVYRMNIVIRRSTMIKFRQPHRCRPISTARLPARMSGGLFLQAYNEPDYGDFWKETRANSTILYAHITRGFREGNPNAVVGGPAFSSTGWYTNFPE